MKTLPLVKPRELIVILIKIGFIKIRQKGSHVFFKHPDGRTTLVPFHKGDDTIIVKR
ncbi:MAG: type II toxin-antitoxin system HicA family toxin [Candidatus Omnitrophica bacterium]|nr:type II toxin-antitoxin system HicA family toxin [Candidatus Omnitrophota bacterium]